MRPAACSVLQLALVAVDARQAAVERGFDRDVRGLELVIEQGERVQ
jgi:hypothetical protein